IRGWTMASRRPQRSEASPLSRSSAAILAASPGAGLIRAIQSAALSPASAGGGLVAVHQARVAPARKRGPGRGFSIEPRLLPCQPFDGEHDLAGRHLAEPPPHWISAGVEVDGERWVDRVGCEALRHCLLLPVRTVFHRPAFWPGVG